MEPSLRRPARLTAVSAEFILQAYFAVRAVALRRAWGTPMNCVQLRAQTHAPGPEAASPERGGAAVAIATLSFSVFLSVSLLFQTSDASSGAKRGSKCQKSGRTPPRSRATDN